MKNYVWLLYRYSCVSRVFNSKFFRTIEGNTGFQDYQEDPMLMAREHESLLSGLKETADGFKKYEKQFDDLKIKVDNHTKHINLLSV